jgi:hypothetical protein
MWARKLGGCRFVTSSTGRAAARKIECGSGGEQVSSVAASQSFSRPRSISQMATAAPAPTMRYATASPIPGAPPVTTATRASKSQWFMV